MKNLFITAILLFSGGLLGQNLENANWTFGKSNRINFLPLNLPPVASAMAVTSPVFEPMEGCATVSDAAGDLCLYSNGIDLWHVTAGVPTLVSSALMGHNSSAQNVIFVPRPNVSQDYFIFTITGASCSGALGAYVSNVNFSGPPVATLPQPLLDFSGNPHVFGNQASEAMTSTIHSDGVNYWVVLAIQDILDNTVDVYSYLVTENGVEDGMGNANRPMQMTTYSIDVAGEYTIGMKISRDTRKIAIINMTENGLVLGSFNNTTGTVAITSHVPFPSGIMYGLEFSPNSKLLYCTGLAGSLFQINTETSSQVGSFTVAGGHFGALQLGLDDEIYMANDASTSIFTIANPDVISPTLTLNSFALGGNTSEIGLPQWVWHQGNCFNTLNQDIDVVAPAVDEEQRIQWIKATNIVNAGAGAIYHAGNFVELNPGFVADVGAKFSAYIEGCSDTFLYRSNKQPGDLKASVKNPTANKTRNTGAGIKVYPNPASTTITVECDTNLKSITILSADGKTVYRQSVNSPTQQIDVSGFSKGIYLIATETQDGKIGNSKFVKN
ncbi:3-coathanger stack domain-containing protein [Flavobacterium sp.]|uniref:3-coathanger stack domain-containing protein n=1 Tax=Flavobacterium sp. TaxID=239 RepID=UPI0039E652CD